MKCNIFFHFRKTQWPTSKKVDCALLPPCAKTLFKKIQHAQYVSIIWGNADSAEPNPDLDPLKYGWKVENKHYIPEWFQGNAVPESLFKEVSASENSEGNPHTEVEDALVDTSCDGE